MRNLLVHADDSPAMAARLQSALAIGRRHRSHITLLVSSPFQQFVASDPFGGMYLAREALAKSQLAATELVDKLSEQMRSEDVPWDISVGDGELLGTLAIAATLADLVIVSLGATGGKRNGAPHMMAGDLAMMVPAPVLALPEKIAMVDLDAPAMIAWNGSLEAANALRQAAPLLGDASNIILVTVGADEGRIDAEDALRYLSRHGLHGTLRREERNGVTVEESLERTARELGAGLIVMGAFGHSRLRETFFGGVTRYLLDAAHTPLLLAH
ncbi:universal stress protein [Sphingopyxis sp.]|uniref:universal stress protein n=1 Tax=Sphingopyxis sp. TaxID=1908224 RepID=UPI003BACE9F8